MEQGRGVAGAQQKVGECDGPTRSALSLVEDLASNKLPGDSHGRKQPVERCTFLSLQSGLGLDAYPIAIDEVPTRIIEVLTLLQGLSNKHRKPLSARFISDGIARMGQRTNLRSPFLQDVEVRAL